MYYTVTVYPTIEVVHNYVEIYYNFGDMSLVNK